jgi:hypothetical protein
LKPLTQRNLQSKGVGVFFTGNKHGLKDCVFPVLSWSHEQECRGFILVHASLTEVTTLHSMIYY